MPCQDCAKPTTSHPPVTSLAILIAASFASPPVDSSITLGSAGTSRASASARSTTGGLSIDENRWSSRPAASRTVATISGWQCPRIALIWPEVKSSTRRPAASNTKLPSARTGANGTKVPPKCNMCRRARVQNAASSAGAPTGVSFDPPIDPAIPIAEWRHHLVHRRSHRQCGRAEPAACRGMLVNPCPGRNIPLHFLRCVNQRLACRVGRRAKYAPMTDAMTASIGQRQAATRFARGRAARPRADHDLHRPRAGQPAQPGHAAQFRLRRRRRAVRAAGRIFLDGRLWRQLCPRGRADGLRRVLLRCLRLYVFQAILLLLVLVVRRRLDPLFRYRHRKAARPTCTAGSTGCATA